MTTLSSWLQKSMGDEYNENLTNSENVTALVEEVQHFRKLMNTLKVFVEDLMEWIEEYEGDKNNAQDTGSIHEQPAVV